MERLCPECGKKCDYDDYKCEHCGEVFWTSREAYEKNLKKIGVRKTDRVKEYQDKINRDADETMICPNCKKETVIVKGNQFAGMSLKSYVCDHCDHFLAGDPKEMFKIGILEILGGLALFGIIALYLAHLVEVKAETNRVGGQAFGIAGFFLLVDGVRRVAASSKAKK